MGDSKEQQASGAWKQFKGRIQEAWGAITGDNIDRYQGKRDQLEGYLEKKTGKSRNEIRQKLDQISKETKYSF